MKKTEFIESVKRMGLFVDETEDNTFIIRNMQGIVYAEIDNNREYTLNTSHAGTVERELYFLLTDFAAVPVERRKDKPKLYEYNLMKGNSAGLQRMVLTRAHSQWIIVVGEIPKDYESAFTDYEIKAAMGEAFNERCMTEVIQND